VKNKLVKLLKMVAVFVVFFSQNSLAADEWRCEGGSSFSPMVRNINVSTYVGNEIPIGSTLYQTAVTVDSAGGVSCFGGTGNYTVPHYFVVIETPLGPPFSFSGMSFGSGQVYPTNISGIGVAITTFSTEIPLTSTPVLLFTDGGTSGDGSARSSTFTLRLIKTGPIASGVQVDASLFPTVQFYIGEKPGYTGLPIKLDIASFSGSVTFTSSTCTTPDVNVDMGIHSVADVFHGMGTTTPWVDASIILQNCPTFSGFHNESTYQWAAPKQTTGNDRTANIMTVSLTPTTSIIDAANGVIAVNNTGSSGQAATGVGLQLGYTPNNYAASATSPTTIWTSGAMWNISPPSSGLGNFKIPLAARYYQTSNTVTAGPANAKVTFNIDYK
jgi:major type 1 subunit fimbrin (pilin)